MTTVPRLPRALAIISIGGDLRMVDDLGGGRYQLQEDVNRFFLKGDVVCAWRKAGGWLVMMRLQKHESENDRRETRNE